MKNRLPPPSNTITAASLGKLDGGEGFNSCLVSSDNMALLAQNGKPDLPCLSYNTATGETSRLAALASNRTAPNKRAVVFAVLLEGAGSMTAEQVTEALNAKALARDGLDYKPEWVQNIRPRMNDLLRLGLIKDSGLRGKSFGGITSIRWEIVTASSVGQDGGQ